MKVWVETEVQRRENRKRTGILMHTAMGVNLEG